MSKLAAVRRIVPSPFTDHKPRSKHANWILPYYVMGGVYPYYDGDNFPTHDMALQNMQALMYDGIDTFVCLQAEISPTGECTYFSKFEFYRDILPNNVEFYHYPIRDGDVLPLIHIENIIEQIIDCVSRKRHVYIHCAGGHGRTGMIAACLLYRIFSTLSMEIVLEIVQLQHDSRAAIDVRTRYLSSVRSPNTSTQRNLCRDYEKYLA